MRRKLAANNTKIEPRRAGSREPGLAGSKELVSQEDEGKRASSAIVIGGTKAVTALEKKPTVLVEKMKGSKETVELRTAGSKDKQLAPSNVKVDVRKGAGKEALGQKPSGGNVGQSASKQTASKENQKTEIHVRLDITYFHVI